MTDPRRLLDDDASCDAERRALGAARTAEPTGELIDEVWSNLAAWMPPTGGAGSTGGAPSGGGAIAGGGAVAGGAGALTIGKAAALGALLGGLVTTGVTVWTAPRSPPSATASVSTNEHTGLSAGREAKPKIVTANAESPIAAIEAAPRGAERTTLTVPQSASSAMPVPLAATPQNAIAPGVGAIAAFSEPSRVAPADAPGTPAPSVSDDTRAEARLVALARDALRAGDAARAFGVLEEARHRYPNGIVSQEREALAIEALVRLGDRSAAITRADAFARNFPSSPHATRVKALVSGL